MTSARRRAWILAMLLPGTAIAGSVSLSQSRSFDLGPGETAFGLTFPQFDLAGQPGIRSLDAVEIRIEATFRAGVMLSGAAGAGVAADWSVGPARVEVVPPSPAWAVPPRLDASVSGSTFVPASADVSITPTPSASVVSTVTMLPPDLSPYMGAGTFACDVDFGGLYHRVRTVPPSVAGLFWSDRITGQLTVTYKASTRDPTPVTLSFFGAQREASGWVAVNWETGVEYDVLGFHLERQDANGSWMRVTPQMLPPLDSTQQPRWYRFEDRTASGNPELRYRLVTVNLDGTTNVTGETPLLAALEAGMHVRRGELELVLTGPAQAAVVVEVSDDLAEDIWAFDRQIGLDAQGRAAVPLGALPDPVRFYRLRRR